MAYKLLEAAEARRRAGRRTPGRARSRPELRGRDKSRAQGRHVTTTGRSTTLDNVLFGREDEPDAERRSLGRWLSPG